mmetsp:Transcript_17293/g.17477  ORF Transcript_17293/g.17477 Transcript_17293/m.17477 type:complete len:109 (-) Transcript_17293:553-879(-)
MIFQFDRFKQIQWFFLNTEYCHKMHYGIHPNERVSRAISMASPGSSKTNNRSDSFTSASNAIICISSSKLCSKTVSCIIYCMDGVAPSLSMSISSSMKLMLIAPEQSQ